MHVLKHNRCRFCSLNCPVAFMTHLDEALALEYDIDAGMHGRLCSKGNYLLEALNHPLRLTEPVIDGMLVTRDTALSEAAVLLNGRIGLIISGNASSEDMLDAQAFAACCQSDSMFAIYTPTGDEQVHRAIATVSTHREAPTFDEIASSACIVTVGDPFEIGPVIAGPVLSSKYRYGKDMVFGAIAGGENRTSKFANRQILGSERRTLAGFLAAIITQRGKAAPAWTSWVQLTDQVPGNVDSLAASFVNTAGAVLVLETQDPVVGVLAALSVEAAGNDKKLVIISSYATRHLDESTAFTSDTIEDIASAVSRGELQSLIVLGEDIAAHPVYGDMLEYVDTLIAGAPFRTKTVEQSDIAFPTAVWLETQATYSGMSTLPVVNPPGYAAGYGTILRSIGQEMGRTLDREPLQEKTVTDVMRDDAIRSFLEELPTKMDTPFETPAFRSSITCHGDGALTGMMSWAASRKVVAL